MHEYMSCDARTLFLLLLLRLPSASIIYYPALHNWERRAHTSPYICWYRIYESSFVVTPPVASVCAYFRVLHSKREDWRARQEWKSQLGFSPVLEDAVCSTSASAYVSVNYPALHNRERRAHTRKRFCALIYWQLRVSRVYVSQTTFYHMKRSPG